MSHGEYLSFKTAQLTGNDLCGGVCAVPLLRMCVRARVSVNTENRNNKCIIISGRACVTAGRFGREASGVAVRAARENPFRIRNRCAKRPKSPIVVAHPLPKHPPVVAECSPR